MPPKKATRESDALTHQLRERSLAKYPGTRLKRPWPGHLDLVVNDKTYTFLSAPGAPFSITCKLPHSRAAALALPNAFPTRYGLGKSGWVTLSGVDELPPIELLEAWIDESYRALAPKALIAKLDAATVATKAGKKKPAVVPAKAAAKGPARKPGG